MSPTYEPLFFLNREQSAQLLIAEPHWIVEHDPFENGPSPSSGEIYARQFFVASNRVELYLRLRGHGVPTNGRGLISLLFMPPSFEACRRQWEERGRVILSEDHIDSDGLLKIIRVDHDGTEIVPRYLRGFELVERRDGHVYQCTYGMTHGDGTRTAIRTIRGGA